MEKILGAIWWFLPAYLANVMPVITAKMKLPGKTPISEIHFGANKTWRGLYSGCLGALVILILQGWLYERNIWTGICLMDYKELSLGELDGIFFQYHERLIIWVLIFGLGTILGDMVGSYIKRWYLLIPPGGMAFPLDQLDFVAGVFVLAFAFSEIGFWGWVVIIIASPALQLLASFIGFHLKLKKVKH